jgi:hypothetical protein
MAAPIRRLILLAMALAGPVTGSVVAPRQEAAAAAAAASTPEYEFIPGPGMPSLESLGLTVADLFNKTWVDSLFKDTPNPFAPNAATARALPATNNNNGQPGSVSRRWDDICDRDGRDYGTVNAVRACAAYLWALNAQWCEAGNTAVEMVRMREGNYETYVHGISVRPGSSRSFCRDCSAGVYWVADSCVAGCDGDLCAAAGSAAAGGNGDLVLVVSGTHN